MIVSPRVSGRALHNSTCRILPEKSGHVLLLRVCFTPLHPNPFSNVHSDVDLNRFPVDLDLDLDLDLHLHSNLESWNPDLSLLIFRPSTSSAVCDVLIKTSLESLWSSPSIPAETDLPRRLPGRPCPFYPSPPTGTFSRRVFPPSQDESRAQHECPLRR